MREEKNIQAVVRIRVASFVSALTFWMTRTHQKKSDAISVFINFKNRNLVDLQTKHKLYSYDEDETTSEGWKQLNSLIPNQENES